MENLIFKKLELWLVFLLLVVIGIGVVFFGSVVKNETKGRETSARESYGWVGDLAYSIADAPSTATQLLNTNPPRRIGGDRFDGRSGWTIEDGAVLPEDYLLLSRSDGDARHHVVELVRLADQKVLWRWDIDAAAYFANVRRDSPVMDYPLLEPIRYRSIHPFPMADGGLLFSNHFTPMVKIDHCGDMQWINEEQVFHHSLNIDADGNFWMPGQSEVSTLARDPNFEDNTLLHVTPEGELLFERSMAEILIDHGRFDLVFQFDKYIDDPLHMNDIEPALTDGPFWKKDDVFISLRNVSAIVLYRPSTDDVVWMRQGPWFGQHDVDIVNDTTISVFSNNAYDNGAGGFVKDQNSVVFYNFETDEITRPFDAGLAEDGVRTLTAGLSDLTASGHLMVEEENSGRIMIYAPDGSRAAEYINRASDGFKYRMGWSRIVSKADGDAIIDALGAGSACAHGRSLSDG